MSAFRLNSKGFSERIKAKRTQFATKSASSKRKDITCHRLKANAQFPLRLFTDEEFVKSINVVTYKNILFNKIKKGQKNISHRTRTTNHLVRDVSLLLYEPRNPNAWIRKLLKSRDYFISTNANGG